MAYFMGGGMEYAFWAGGTAMIVIRDNTSSVNHTSGVPIWGAVVSPQIGHDGTSYLFSNFDYYLGTY